jgi:hypothetical protein
LNTERKSFKVSSNISSNSIHANMKFTMEV